MWTREDFALVRELGLEYLRCGPPYYQVHQGPDRYDWSYANEDDWRFVTLDGEPALVRVTGNLITNSSEMLRTLALEGQGIFLAPSFLASDDVKEGRLVELLPHYRPVEFSINAIYPHRSFLSLKARSFIDLATERLTVLNTWLNPPVAAD